MKDKEIYDQTLSPFWDVIAYSTPIVKFPFFVIVSAARLYLENLSIF